MYVRLKFMQLMLWDVGNVNAGSQSIGKIHENPPDLSLPTAPLEELDEPMSFTISDLYPSFLAQSELSILFSSCQLQS